MIAQQKPDFIALSEEMYKQHADETIRAQCRAREDFEARERATKKHIANLTSEIEALSSENEALSSENDFLKKSLKLTISKFQHKPNSFYFSLNEYTLVFI